MANPKGRLGMLGMVVLLGAGTAVHCKKAVPCRATITLAERESVGTGADKPQALAQACTHHCVEHDPLVDGKYRVWRAAGGKGGGKRAEAVQSVPVLKRYFDACHERCAKEAKHVRYVDCNDP